MLLINFVMFVFIVVYIRALDKKQRDFNLTSGKRNEMAEKYDQTKLEYHSEHALEKLQYHLELILTS